MAKATSQWPDPLTPPDPNRVAHLLSDFWAILGDLGNRLAAEEYLLANDLTHQLRSTVLEMMLALNGIERPSATETLNLYLSSDQREAISRTMVLPGIDTGAWVGQAVALVVIYRWYASQLSTKYAIPLPVELETQVWEILCQQLPDWPSTLSTD